MSLTKLPIHDCSAKQIDIFSKENLHSKELASFNPFKSSEILQECENSLVIVGDIGGDSVEIGKLIIKDGYPSVQSDQKVLESSGGSQYVEVFEEAAELARKYNLPVGISYGGPLDGSKPLFH